MTDPWHTLTVTATYGHRNCDCGETCKGHPEPEVGQDPGDIEVDTELAHPEDCPPSRPCCCQDPKPDPLLALLAVKPCGSCLFGAHEYCRSTHPSRCQTEFEITECYTENELPRETGVYRVQGWATGPDYEGEYDGGVNCEPMPTPQASEP
jgi:hypothetical protein